MNRKEIIHEIAQDLDLAKKDIESVVKKYEEKITDALSKHLKVQLHGFGNFEVRKRAARIARVPSTGEPVEVPESHGVGFKPSSVLKDAVKVEPEA